MAFAPVNFHVVAALAAAVNNDGYGWLRCVVEIGAGDVFISNNPRLCHVDTINWDDILPTVRRFTVSIDNIDTSAERCQYWYRSRSHIRIMSAALTMSLAEH